MKHLLPCLFALMAFVAPASAKTICTVIADAETSIVLLEQGDCRSRVTPASTFKIALSVMGFDAGFLVDANTPALPFKTGYADWGGDNWKQPTDPTRWLKYSVVWFSQQITAALGVDALHSYADAFGYGNADFSGDAGKNNALERAWISSSLKIAPVEQVAFLRNLINGDLPVQSRAIDMTMAIVETTPAGGGWVISGKTGAAYPRLADRSFDRTKGWGWFVGWATKEERTLVFARLDQDEQRQSVSAGIRAKEALLHEWPGLVSARPQ
ncbi:MAG TPA: class D beta-lactamase [Devosia sp.]|nr:class D beta-lactamase [Devosia sp.]